MALRRKFQSLTITEQKNKEKITLNNKKAARTRRQRGYQWEDTIVKRFNSTELESV